MHSINVSRTTLTWCSVYIAPTYRCSVSRLSKKDNFDQTIRVHQIIGYKLLNHLHTMRNLVLLCYLHMVHIALPITCMQGHLIISVLNHAVLRLNILSCQDYTNGTVTVGSTGAFNSVLHIIYVSSLGSCKAWGQRMSGTKWETGLQCCTNLCQL